MPRFHTALAAWLRDHHGVVTHTRLLELGLTLAQIRALLAAGELVVVHEGVYRHTMSRPATLASYLAAACAADPDPSSRRVAEPHGSTGSVGAGG